MKLVDTHQGVFHLRHGTHISIYVGYDHYRVRLPYLPIKIKEIRVFKITPEDTFWGHEEYTFELVTIDP